MNFLKDSLPVRGRTQRRHIAVKACLAGLIFALAAAVPARALEYQRVQPLLDTGETVIGQPFSYPQGSPAEVTAAIVTLLPGEETGWHIHGVPLFGHMLEGELTVDYGDAGTKVYHAGDSLIEAIDHPHNGVNTGTGVMRVLVVFMSSADGVETKPVEAPGN